jgi:hypothetical protein
MKMIRRNLRRNLKRNPKIGEPIKIKPLRGRGCVYEGAFL